MNAIIKEGLICIFRGVPKGKIIPTAKAVFDGGVRIIEVAFNPAAPETAMDTAAAISAIKTALPEMTVGAGTVVSKKLVEIAYKADAQFIFSPNFNPDVVRLTKKLGMLSIPGAYTPSECAAAYDAGADVVKMFPVTVNDTGYINNIMRPLNYIPFICVGGVNENTIEEFFKVGACGVGTGISIVKNELVESENYSEITRLAKAHMDVIRECQKKYGTVK